MRLESLAAGPYCLVMEAAQMKTLEEQHQTWRKACAEQALRVAMGYVIRTQLRGRR